MNWEDAVWIIIIIAIFGLPMWATGHILAWWDNRQEKQAIQLAKIGAVYPIPRMVLQYGVWLILTVLGIWLFFSLMAEGDDQIGLNLAMLLLFLFVLPLVLWDLWLNSGVVLLTETGVELHKWWGTKRLDYAGIQQIKETNWYIPPHLVLYGDKTSLPLNRQMANFDDFYAQLHRRSNPFREAIQPSEPNVQTHWKVKPIGFWFNLIGMGAFAGSFLIMAIVLNINSSFDTAEDIFNGICGNGLFLAMTVLIIWLYISQELKPKQPSEIRCDREKFECKLPWGGWQSVPATKLSKLEMMPAERVVRRRGISVSAMEYPITIHFDDGDTITIDERRARQFGTSTQQVYTLLKQMYDL